MRYVAPAIQAARASRAGTYARLLLWVTARNRSTGATETAGLWNGDDHQTFTIGGQTRTYYGAGNVLNIPVLQAVVGVEVRSYDIGLSAVSPEVEAALRGYDTRGGRVEIHRAEFDAEGNLLAEPERVLKGRVEGAPILTPSIGGEAVATLRVVSSAWVLTRHGHVTKSDEMQKRRQGDRFRRYASITAAATTYWGEKRAQSAASSDGRVALRKSAGLGDE